MRALIWNAAWELFWAVVAICLAYGLAWWKGDEWLAKADERRREREWKSVATLVEKRIELALWRALWATVKGSKFALPSVPHEIASRGYFGQWALRLRAILDRKGPAQFVQEEHLRPGGEDRRLVHGISVLGPAMQQANQQLLFVLMSFPEALPTELKKALMEAVVSIEQFAEHAKPLTDDLETIEPKEYWFRITQNSQHAATAFDAIEKLFAMLAKRRLAYDSPSQRRTT